MNQNANRCQQNIHQQTADSFCISQNCSSVSRFICPKCPQFEHSMHSAQPMKISEIKEKLQINSPNDFQSYNIDQIKKKLQDGIEKIRNDFEKELNELKYQFERQLEQVFQIETNQYIWLLEQVRNGTLNQINREQQELLQKMVTNFENCMNDLRKSKKEIIETIDFKLGDVEGKIKKCFSSAAYIEYQNGNKQQQDQSIIIRYEGDVLDNKRHGRGTMYYSNGDKYEGDFWDDAIHGFGKLWYFNQKEKQEIERIPNVKILVMKDHFRTIRGQVQETISIIIKMSISENFQMIRSMAWAHIYRLRKNCNIKNEYGQYKKGVSIGTHAHYNNNSQLVKQIYSFELQISQNRAIRYDDQGRFVQEVEIMFLSHKK